VPEKLGIEATQATAALKLPAAGVVLGLFPPAGAVYGSLLCPKKSALRLLRQREGPFVQALVLLGGVCLPAGRRSSWQLTYPEKYRKYSAQID